MALARRSGGRFTGTIWPGFVDALTALLLILMFVLSIFMIVQFSLRERITGQDEELQSLGQQLVQLSNELAIETTRADDLEETLGTVRTTLGEERSEVDRLTAALSAMTARYEGASAEAERLDAALDRVTEARDAAAAEAETLGGRLEQETAAREALAQALAAARAETDEATEAARLAAARREALEALVAELRSETKALESETEEAKAEAVRLDNQRLAALARISALEEDAASARERAAALEDADARAAAEARARAEAEAALERTSSEAERIAAERDEALARIGTLEDDRLALVERLSRLDEERLAAVERLAAAEDEKLAALERLSTLEQEKLTAIERAEAAESQLSEEEEARLVEAAAARALRRRLEAQADELDAVTLALEEARREAEQTLTLLAAAEEAKATLEGRLENRTETIDQEEQLRRIAEAALADAKEQTLAERRKVALLNARVSELRSQLSALQALLDDAEDRDAAQEVQIADLGQRLNQALARKVSDLARYRSVFFEKMEGVLGGRQDIQRVGDRFVFQSEVLFDPGSAQLGPDGRRQLAKLGEVLREVSGDMPDDIDWILRVDGHTDRRPLSGTGRYRNNWELSFARALSVVEYLIEEEGVPPGRLAATGFGEFQPIDEGDSDEAYARNRRIEFKFTER